MGSDLRWDKGQFANKSLPVTKYTSIAGSGGMPGIIFSGGASGSTPDFGLGGASANNWQVGLNPNIDIFATNHNQVPTSYTVLSASANANSLENKMVNPPNLNNILLHKVNEVEGNLTINADYTFPTGSSMVLVHGDIYINANITVPTGSTAVISASGDITVAANVTNIQGVYSAGSDFIIETNSKCPGIPDASALNVAGTVVANAEVRQVGHTDGTFINKRTFCPLGNTVPSVIFTERPDFIVNYPTMVQQTFRFWQEIAP